MKEWRFDRYHKGHIMAEGAVVTADNEVDARLKAAALFHEYPEYRRDTFVLQPPERCGPYCDLPEGHEGPHDHSAFPTEGSPT